MNTVRYAAALGAIKVVQEQSLLNLTPDAFKFLTSDKPWVSTDRGEARRVVEAATFGSLDYLGFQHIAVPAEFIAAAIAHFVHPNNMMTACTVMDGIQWSEEIINGTEVTVTSKELFAHVLQILGGNHEMTEARVRIEKKQLALKGQA